MESIAGSVGVSAPTIKSWLSILEKSFIIHFLEPDSNNLGKTVVKTPKLYFVDSGLLCHLLRLETKEDLLKAVMIYLYADEGNYLAIEQEGEIKVGAVTIQNYIIKRRDNG